MEVILGIPIDGEAIVGTTDKTWADECRSMLGINPTGTVLKGKRILIKKLLEKIDKGCPMMQQRWLCINMHSVIF